MLTYIAEDFGSQENLLYSLAQIREFFYQEALYVYSTKCEELLIGDGKG